MPPNKSLQGPVSDKVLGRGRFAVRSHVMPARVPTRQRAGPALSRYAPGDLDA
jgi:hypothetical protein